MSAPARESTREPAVDAGLRPTLPELIALRQAGVQGRQARRGRYAVSGRAASSMRGRGMEYAESREYVAGDDARHIDWKLTARTDATHTKTFQTERERVTLVIADTSAALYFGTRVRFKSVQAARAGAVAAWSAMRDGDRLAALRGARQQPLVPPAGGTRGVLRVLDALVRWYAEPPADDAGLQLALERAARVLHPGARAVVLADPASALAVPAAVWSALSMHVEVQLILLVDRLETDPPHCLLPVATPAGRMRFDLVAEGVRQSWHEALVGPMETLLRQLPGRRVRVTPLASDQASDAWLGASAQGAY
ncbi:DUF58 domain-containing protein [Stenotrophomonas sp. STM01]|uniref:DUF58 domain-containing protein n=1 Tax=Stenotrophomonas sp. STM01 TaxID=2769278 RepID=UPI00177ACE8F|nr:DUF58 domain-containing protein [Stenotrophomonas sp. STM01]MBD9536470.1 DUF58 domain-containing protein [Stenotrophomonas sp. STM01]